MGTPFSRAPHRGGAIVGANESPHAALLIDFDNVTMGMRSDLSKELKSLLASDVIKGKVSVQRAYADWRRYPQYIVPLSEASVDLIFAPAYGSNKKNATDIRMAIDAVELVFTRPEIGTYILLTGDSDFSSLVLKLKEYGKYVIGVGIQESSSDILVQNCDEYYSYTSLTGLKKTTESDQKAQDPWVLVSSALKRMVDRNDVMRSDRLKQVMQEIDTGFDESSFGFSKFSKFLAEASSRGLVHLKKMENGQYEVAPSKGGRDRRDDRDRDRGGRRDRGRGRRDRGERGRPPREDRSEAQGGGEDPLTAAYDLLTRAMESLLDAGRIEVRDSDVKRKLLELDRSFDETELGFPKFSKFLSQASDHGVVVLDRTDTGNFTVSLGDGSPPAQKVEESAAADSERAPERDRAPDREPEPEWSPEDEGQMEVQFDGVSEEDPGLRLGPRLGSTRRRGGDDPPPIFEGQGIAHPSSGGESRAAVATAAEPFDASELGLPTDPDAIVRYMAHRYRGVGEKTAETLVERFGRDVFQTLRDEPEAISDAVTPKRAEQVLEAWNTDYERRTSRKSGS